MLTRMWSSRNSCWVGMQNDKTTVEGSWAVFHKAKCVLFLATSCEELIHWKRPWCWEGLGAGGEGDDRGWDRWMASLTRWTWVWVNSGSWWWTGRPGMLQFMGSQRVGHDWVTDLIWSDIIIYYNNYYYLYIILLLFSDRTTRYLPDWTEDLPSHKKLHENIYSTFIHNHPKLETIQMSFKTGILSSHDLVPEDLSWNWCNNKEMKCTINGMHLNHPEIIPIPSHLLSMEKLSYTKPVQSLYQKSWALLL